MNGAQALAAAVANDVGDTVFGLLGDGNLTFVDELVVTHGVQFIATRHEHAAVAAALGWAHASGGIGIATTTHGPGLVQTASALITAVKSAAPVLLITGATHPAARLHAQRTDQRAFAVACGAAHVQVASESTILQDLDVARRTLKGGPVVFEVGLDVLNAEVPTSTTLPRLALPPPVPCPSLDPAAVAAAVQLLSAGRRPLVLLGRGAVGALDTAEGLADQIGALVGTTLLGQGLLSDHPSQLGVIGGFSSVPTRKRLLAVDVVLAVGASLTRYTTDSGRLFAGVPIIQIDCDPQAIGDPVGVEVGIVADAETALRAIAARLPVHLDPAPGSRELPDPTLPPEPRRVRADPDGDDPRDVLDAIDSVVPEERGVVVGVGHYSGWASLHLHTTKPSDKLLPWHFGAVGIALGAAMGMAAAAPHRPTVCVEGDGGIMMTLPELDTIARFDLPILVVVLDDGGFGAEAHLLARAGRVPDQAWIQTPDLVATAQGLGLRAATARGDQLRPTVRDLLQHLPALLHVLISRRAVHDEIFEALAP